MSSTGKKTTAKNATPVQGNTLMSWVKKSTPASAEASAPPVAHTTPQPLVGAQLEAESAVASSSRVPPQSGSDTADTSAAKASNESSNTSHGPTGISSSNATPAASPGGASSGAASSAFAVITPVEAKSAPAASASTAMDDDDDDGPISLGELAAKRRAALAAASSSSAPSTFSAPGGAAATKPATSTPVSMPSALAALSSRPSAGASGASGAGKTASKLAASSSAGAKRSRPSSASSRAAADDEDNDKDDDYDDDGAEDDDDDDDDDDDMDEDDDDDDGFARKKAKGKAGRASSGSAPARASKGSAKAKSTPATAAKRKKADESASPAAGGAGPEDDGEEGEGKAGVLSAGQHKHNRLDFLKPDKIKDAEGRRPDHPDYDPRTLFVPPSYLYGDGKGDKVTPAQQQWWKFKAQYFDTVLFFKQGKFYEMFNQDADIGVAEGGLTYMKGEAAHCGFPEISFGAVSGALVSKGYRIARVEQTESPEQMKARKEYEKARGKKKSNAKDKTDDVMRRELCGIKSKGTATAGVLDVYAGANVRAAAEQVEREGQGVPKQFDAAYGDITQLTAAIGGHADSARALYAIKEVPLHMEVGAGSTNTGSAPESTEGAAATAAVGTAAYSARPSDAGAASAGPVLFGIAILDTMSCEVRLAQFVDDAHRTRLRTLMSRIKPAEIAYEEVRPGMDVGKTAEAPPTGLSEWTWRVLQYDAPAALHTKLRPVHDFWTPARTVAELKMQPYAELLQQAYAHLGDAATAGAGSSAAPAGNANPLDWDDPEVLETHRFVQHKLAPGFGSVCLMELRSRDYFLVRGDEDDATTAALAVAQDGTGSGAGASGKAKPAAPLVVLPGPDGRSRAYPAVLHVAMEHSAAIGHSTVTDARDAVVAARAVLAEVTAAGDGTTGSAAFKGCDVDLGPTALGALGAIVHILRRHLIEHPVLSMRRVSRYAHADGVEGSLALADAVGLPPLPTGGADAEMDTGSAVSASPDAVAQDPEAGHGEGVGVAHMALDSTALAHLEVLETSEGNKKGSILGLLDTCAGTAGRARIRAWVASPLLDPKDVNDRLQAVENLLAVTGRTVDQSSPFAATATAITSDPSLSIPGMALHDSVRKALMNMPDLERLLARIHRSGSRVVSTDHPDARAVMYEDKIYGERKIEDMMSALKAFRSAQAVRDMFHIKGAKAGAAAGASSSGKTGSTGLAPWVKAPMLVRCTHARFPDLADLLAWFDRHYDMARIAKEGRVEPSPGVDPSFDSADAEMRSVRAELKDYEKSIRVELSCRDVCYGNEDIANKEPYLIEVPQAGKDAVPEDWRLVGQRKAGKAGTIYKYVSPEAEAMVKRLQNAAERKDEASRDALRKLFARFDSHAPHWQAAASCIATLDCLFALATWSATGDGGAMCRPVFVEVAEEGSGVASDGSSEPFLHARGARHPTMAAALASGNGLTGAAPGVGASTFIPNDIIMGQNTAAGAVAGGGDETMEGPTASPLAILLTGPNMGGKSTFLRTACSTVLLAQLGAYVPAESCVLTPVDRIFTRVGAHDRILAGQSTFYVELAETAVILGQATRSSLVILDELGRGTSTFDGAAIAYAVTKHLTDVIRCRTLFATHYHTLCDDFGGSDKVALGHMTCLTTPRADGTHEVTFLYKYGPGACPASHGLNVARLARLPEDVIARAMQQAQAFEAAVLKAQGKAAAAGALVACGSAAM